jgi:hypothetical protein
MLRIHRSHARKLWPALSPVLLACVVGSGCGGSGGSAPPKTYPVRGKVFYKGNLPFSGGVIQFQSESDPSLTRMGDIEEDGTFSLVTLFQNERLEGTTEGRYHVTVIPRMSENKPVPIFQLPHVYTVKPEDNFFSVELDKTKERPPR